MGPFSTSVIAIVLAVTSDAGNGEARAEACRRQNRWAAVELPLSNDGITPCWVDNTTHGGSHGAARHCIPIAYILGFPKCGTTTLFHRMSLHPGLTPATHKEPHWWTRCHKVRTTSQGHCSPTQQARLLHNTTVSSPPVSGFAMAAAAYADRDFSSGSPDTLAFEASASTAWDAGPMHCGDSVPLSMRRAYGARWASKLRFVVLVRDPVERSWSDFVYAYRHRNRATSSSPSADRFHTLVVSDLAEIRSCIERSGVELCAVHHMGELRIHVGLYAPLLRRWFRVFSRDQFLLLKSESYFADPARTLTQTFDFLEVKRPPSDVWTAMLANLSASESRSSHASSSKRTFMRPDTANLLREFFAPFETELAEMLSVQKGS